MPQLDWSTSWLLRFARKIRHAPGLRRLDSLWRQLRPAYHQLLNGVHGREGIPISVGPAATLHVPVSFAHHQVDPHELRMLEKLMAETHADTCFYDIGASVGLHSLAAGEKINRAGEIHAFEPDLPSGYEYRNNTRLLRQRGIPMRLHPCFVAETSRDFAINETQLDLNETHPLDRGPTRHLYFFEETSAAEHPVVSIDDYVRAGARPPTVLKCDVEGAELLMLRGARETLRHHRPRLFVSVHPALLPRFGHTDQAVYAELETAGYRWELIDSDGEDHIFAQPILSHFQK